MDWLLAATGVLLVLVGEATKVSDFLMQREKEYEAVMVLGVTTDTQDGEGRELSRDGRIVTAEEVEKALNGFSGPQKQVPPMLSAKKHRGRKLYELFRRGVTVRREPEKIEIKSITMSSFDFPEVGLRLVCSKGTYVRTLCNDIGKRLGCGAHMSSLVRTRVGRFSLKDSVGFTHGIDYEGKMLPLNSVMSSYPHLLVNSKTADGIRNGKQISESEVINMEAVREEYGSKRSSEVFPVFDEKHVLLAMVHACRKNASGRDVRFRLLRVMA